MMWSYRIGRIIYKNINNILLLQKYHIYYVSSIQGKNKIIKKNNQMLVLGKIYFATINFVINILI